MLVVENVDKAAFVAKLKPVNAQFEKDFGKDKIDAIRNYK
jgi:TRAP-type C4-dicarboxylate transport system substrate-binding protein